METAARISKEPIHNLNTGPYRYPVPENSPLHALRKAMDTDDAETAWGHTVRAIQQTAEEFYVLAVSATSDRIRLTALKTYERLVREMARHFEWLAKRDQKDADRAARDLKAVTSEKFANGAVKTMAEGERAKLPASLPPRPAPLPERGRRGEAVLPRPGTEKHGTTQNLTRQQRRRMEREQAKAAEKAAREARREEAKRAA